MKLDEFGVGRITAQNTTKDVKPGQTEKEAKKFFGGKGKPKLLHPTAAKNSNPNTLFNLGLAEDITELKIVKPDPADTLGIERKYMPQVKTDDYPEFIEYLKQNGATFSKQVIPASEIKAMQKEFSDAGIVKQLEKMLAPGAKRKPAIMSSDNYIIDGHHRWLVAVNTGQDLEVYRVNMPAQKLYDLVNKFEKVYYKDIYDETKPVVGVPLSSGLRVSIFPHRPLKVKKSTAGKLRYDEDLNSFINALFLQNKRQTSDIEDYEKLKSQMRKRRLGLKDDVTPVDIAQLERFADKLFGKVGIDVAFTKHFMDRVHDERNVKPITPAELTRIFKQEYKRWGKPIAQLGPDQEAVMKDLATDINIPFALKYDRENDELDLIAKTVMRKKDFQTPNTEFPVENSFADLQKGLKKTFGNKGQTKTQTTLQKTQQKPGLLNKVKQMVGLSDGVDVCVNCGHLVFEEQVNEDLRDWFKEKWVNIGKKDKDGKHPPCGTSGKKKGYAKCVPAAKAAKMSKKEKESATRRKRAAQNKAGRGGKDKPGSGKKPIRVSTKAESIQEAFVKPQFHIEWDEAARYPEFVKIGKEAWIELAKKGKAVTIKDASDINNTDAADPKSFYLLDPAKQKRALAQLEKGKVEMPIVAVYSDGYKELIGGNTRLTAMMFKNGQATVWQFEVPDDVAELAENLDEGVNDPHIFKAVFLAGGPGSGKSFVAKNLLGGTGLRPVNSDDLYEFLMSKEGLALDPETIASPQGQEIRARAKELTGSRKTMFLDGRLGLIIDGTGKDVSKYQKQVEALKSLGYDTMMIFVNTSLEVAQQRNRKRARSIKPEMVEKMWNEVQQNLMKFQQVFGAGRFHIIDNSGGLEDLDRKENFDKVYVETQRFLNTPPSKRAALAWIQQQKAQTNAKRTQPTDQRPNGGIGNSN